MTWRRLILELEITDQAAEFRDIQGRGALTTELRELAEALTHRASHERKSEDHLQALRLEAAAYGVDLRFHGKDR